MGNVLEDPARSPAATCASRRADARPGRAAGRRRLRRIRLGAGRAGVQAGHALPGARRGAEEQLLEQDRAFVAGRTAGDNPLDVAHAGQLRAKAAHDAKSVGKTAPPSGPATFNGAWAGVGPAPIGQIQRSDYALNAVSGRIGALAIRPEHRPASSSAPPRAASGPTTATGPGPRAPTTRTTQAIGALAVAPSQRRDRLHGHRRGRALRRQLLRQRHLQVHRRRHDLVARLAATTSRASRSRGSSSTRPTPNHLYAAVAARPRRHPPRDRASRTRVRHLGVHRRRRRLDAAQGRPTSPTAPPTSRWTRRTRTSSRRRSGATRSTRAPTAARPGRRS